MIKVWASIDDGLPRQIGTVEEVDREATTFFVPPPPAWGEVHPTALQSNVMTLRKDCICEAYPEERGAECLNPRVDVEDRTILDVIFHHQLLCPGCAKPWTELEW